MKKLVEAIFWVLLFLSPVTMGAIGAFFLYSNNYGALSIICLLAGLFSGVLFAESVRKKHGTSAFFSKTYSFNSGSETQADKPLDEPNEKL